MAKSCIIDVRKIKYRETGRKPVGDTVKKIVLITSSYTGHGHKSISDSLMEQFSEMPDLEVRVVDGFELLGEIGVQLSKMYGPMTRYASHFWKVTWDISDRSDRLLKSGISSFSLTRFRQLMESFQPDLILSVHSMFNGSILKLLRHSHLNIPLVTLQADIINIHKTWCEPGTLKTICPTPEAYECSLKHGMPADKLVLMGFPTRRRFTDLARTCNKPDYDGSRPLRCLMMSGGEGSGNLKRYASVLLSETDVELTIICGRNKKIRKSLADAFLPQYAGRLRVLGFVTEIQNEMADSDLLIARGSPNSLMEGVVMNLPLMVTGALPGQERDNPRLIADHHLGVISNSPEEAPALIRQLLADDQRLYREIRAAQREYRNLDNAKNIAEYVVGLIPSGK